jgi:1,4-dihydroxy-2-naphthoyl-CoA hydrolase
MPRGNESPALKRLKSQRGRMSLIDRINASPLPFAQLLGIEFLSAEADALSARMLIRPELCTMGGVAHGGAIMSFADTLGAAAAFINLPADSKATTTIESKTNFLSSAAANSTVIGRTSMVHRGRRTQVWQTLVATEDEKLVALIVQTQMNL